MEDKHPIDKLFREGLGDPEIPFDERGWTALSRKMHPRKRWPLFIGVGGGIAAAVVIAVLLFSDHEQAIDNQIHVNTTQPPPVVEPRPDPMMPRDTNQAQAVPRLPQSAWPDPTGAPIAITTPLPATKSQRPYLAHVLTQRPTPGVGMLSLHPAGVVSSQLAASPNDQRFAVDAPLPQRGWTLGVMAAPDLSGARPLSGKLGGNMGLMATYRLNDRLSITSGILYAKKLYQTGFANYRPASNWHNPQQQPQFVAADCDVLDIPLNINFNFVRQQRSTWFTSAGVSSYVMLRERYDYIYPPHEYGYPKQVTLHNRNRHILGIGNVAVGYRRKLSPSISISVQPFVKVPLTGIGNGHLKLYSSGVALSIDLDLVP